MQKQFSDLVGEYFWQRKCSLVFIVHPCRCAAAVRRIKQLPELARIFNCSFIDVPPTTAPPLADDADLSAKLRAMHEKHRLLKGNKHGGIDDDDEAPLEVVRRRK